MIRHPRFTTDETGNETPDMRTDRAAPVPLRLLTDGGQHTWHLTLTPEFEAAGIDDGDIVSFTYRRTAEGPVLVVTAVPNAAVADHGANERRVVGDQGTLFVSPPRSCIETAGGTHRGFRIDADTYDGANPLLLESSVTEGRVRLVPLDRKPADADR